MVQRRSEMKENNQDFKLISVSIHIGDLVTDTIGMSTLEYGAYMRLIFAHYRAGLNGLPNDDRKLARIAGLSVKKWKAIKEDILQKFIVKDDFIYKNRVRKEFITAKEKSDKARANALKRYETGSADAEQAQSKRTANPEPLTLNPEPSIEKEKSIKEKDWKNSLPIFEKYIFNNNDISEWVGRGFDVTKMDYYRNRVIDYCRAKGKSYKNYFSAMKNFATSDLNKGESNERSFKDATDEWLAEQVYDERSALEKPD